MISKTLFAFVISFQLAISYGQTLEFKTRTVNAEKWSDIQLVVPVEIEIHNSTGSDINHTLILNIGNRRAAQSLQLTSAELTKIAIRDSSILFSLKKGKKITKTAYIVLDKSLQITNNRTFFIDATIGTIATSLEVNLRQANDLPYTLSDYINNNDITLDYVTKVESSNNLLTVYGEKDNSFQKRIIALRRGEVYAVLDKKYLISFSHFNFLDAFSLFAVPYKVRPQVTTKIKNIDTTFPKSATSGISTIGLNLDMAKLQVDRYFSNGKKSTHKLSAGIFIAPTVEELDSISTKAYLRKDVKSKQLFISTALTISYTYNDISFVFVPCGWDLSTSKIGKNWIYDGRMWWGFGIGISPKILSTVFK